jgi:hypothetical protein
MHLSTTKLTAPNARQSTESYRHRPDAQREGSESEPYGSHAACRISLQRYDVELGLTAASRGRLVEAVPTFKPGEMDPLERALCGLM